MKPLLIFSSQQQVTFVINWGILVWLVWQWHLSVVSLQWQMHTHWIMSEIICICQSTVSWSCPINKPNHFSAIRLCRESMLALQPPRVSVSKHPPYTYCVVTRAVKCEFLRCQTHYVMQWSAHLHNPNRLLLFFFWKENESLESANLSANY